MGLIQKLLGKTSEDKEGFKKKFKDAQENEKIERLITERNKSSNRRELERYMKEQEESKIKETLDKIHKQNNYPFYNFPQFL